MLFFGTAERASRSLPGTSTCKVADAGHGEWDFFEPNRAVQLSPCTVAKKKRKKEEEKKEEEKKEKKPPILGLASRSMSIKESMIWLLLLVLLPLPTERKRILAFPSLAPIRLRARDKQSRAGKKGSDIILRVQKAVRRARPSQDG